SLAASVAAAAGPDLAALGADVLGADALGDVAFGDAAAVVAAGDTAGFPRELKMYHVAPPPTITAKAMNAVSTTRPAPVPSTCVGAPAMSGVGRRPGWRGAAGVGTGTVAGDLGTGRCTVGAFGCGTAIASVPVLERALSGMASTARTRPRPKSPARA